MPYQKRTQFTDIARSTSMNASHPSITAAFANKRHRHGPSSSFTISFDLGLACNQGARFPNSSSPAIRVSFPFAPPNTAIRASEVLNSGVPPSYCFERGSCEIRQSSYTLSGPSNPLTICDGEIRGTGSIALREDMCDEIR